MRTAAAMQQRFTRRALMLGGAQGLVGLLLAARMSDLAIRDGERFRLLAEDNRVALRLIAPRRGWIVDRNGQPLAFNQPDYRLELTPDDSADIDATLAALSTMMPIGPDMIARIKDQAARQPGYVPIEVVAGLPWEVFAAIAVRLPELAGVRPVKGFRRTYAGGAAYGHLLGYVARPNAEEYAETKNRLLLLPGFKVGRDGVEKTLDERLRGKAGARREEVNARGRPVRELETMPDTPGDTIKLTINRELQDFVARRVAAESASVIMMDVWTGDILAQVSMPAYDPNDFSDGISHIEWTLMQENERHPLINKAVQGVYPPGSTFKMATALAVLGAGIPPTAGVVCRGGYSFGGHFFRCHRRGGHGRVDVRSAIPASCNPYFYHYGRIVGVDAIAAAATELGLGQRYEELPMPSQRRGVVPTVAWKEERYGKAWLPGETLSCAIGQGYVAATPLQLAVMTSRLASGRRVMPRLLMDGPAPAASPLAFPVEHLDLVRTGMTGVVNSGIGTARRTRLAVPGVRLAGKTGTAQAVGRERRPRGAESRIPWRFRNHAWFVGFAPADEPRYAMAILVEHGGAGGAIAGPIARDVMTFMFEPERSLTELAKLEGQWQAAEAARAERALAEARRLAEARAAEAAAAQGVAAPAAPAAAVPPVGRPFTT